MADDAAGGNSRFAAARRRRVYEMALQDGSVNVSALAQALGTSSATIRRDLNALEKLGVLTRSFGGAVVNKDAVTRPLYALTRDTHMREKAWIGAAAAQFVPDSGTVFIAGGTTTRELAVRIPEGLRLHVVTTSVDVACSLVSRDLATVHLLGGLLRSDTFTTNCSADPALEMLYWDVTFLGVAGLSVERGLSTVDHDGALCMRKIIERGNRLVLLCDSSKLGCHSHAQVGPVTLADVLITDIEASPDTVEEIRALGVEVVVAGEHGGCSEEVMNCEADLGKRGSFARRTVGRAGRKGRRL